MTDVYCRVHVADSLLSRARCYVDDFLRSSGLGGCSHSYSCKTVLTNHWFPFSKNMELQNGQLCSI